MACTLAAPLEGYAPVIVDHMISAKNFFVI